MSCNAVINYSYCTSSKQTSESRRVRNQIADLTKRVVRSPSMWLLLFVAACTCALFWNHLAGTLSFPWDFPGTYHTHAVARFRDGTFLAPPLWMPWGGFGIPSHISLQDGAWYLPFYLYATIDGYDIVAATRLQVLHVFFGAAGAFLLCRSFGLSRGGAFVATIAYLWSSTFYSNAQHVDIVRGAALLPWLLVAIHSLWKTQDAVRFGLFVLVLWQYLIAAYPGQIVATGYFCALVMLVLGVAAHRRTEPVLKRSLMTAFGVACAAALVSVKFLPALLDPETVRQSTPPEALANAAIYTTLLFRYDVPFLPNDLTMRDLFVPWALLPFACIGLRRSTSAVIAVAGIVLSLIMITDVASVRAFAEALPMTSVSRFPLSDYRPILHLSICLLVAGGVTRSLQGQVSKRRWLLIGGVACALLGLTWYGLKIGHSAGEAAWGVAALGLSVAACVGLTRMSSRPAMQSLLVATVAALVAVQGTQHIMAAARVWRAERTPAYEYATYGNSIAALTSVNRFEALDHRPRRVVYETLPVDHPTQLFSPKYQYAWYAEGFSAFGYEIVKSSPALLRVYAFALTSASDKQRAVLGWLLRPSSVFVLPAERDLGNEELTRCTASVCTTSLSTPVLVRMEAFRENGAVYRIRSTSPFSMVENEVMYSGWSSLICRGHDCRAGMPARRTNFVLRTWNLPSGDYRLITYYRPPAWDLAVAITWSGAISALLLIVILGAMEWSSRSRRRFLKRS